MYGHPDSDKANDTAEKVLEILQTQAATPQHPHTDVPLIEWAIAWDPGDEVVIDDERIKSEPQWRIRAKVNLCQTLMIVTPFNEEAFEGVMEPDQIAESTMDIVMGELTDLKVDLDRVMQAVAEWSES